MRVSTFIASSLCVFLLIGVAFAEEADTEQLPWADLDGELQVVHALPTDVDAPWFREYLLVERPRAGFGGKPRITKLEHVEEFVASHKLRTGLHVRAGGRLRGAASNLLRALDARNMTVDVDPDDNERHVGVDDDDDNNGRSDKRAVQVANVRKPAVIFVNMADGSPAISKATFDAYYSSNSNNFRKLVTRMTNGAFAFAAAGAGYSAYVVTISASVASCDYNTWVSQSIAAAQRKGMVLANHNHLALVTPDTATACKYCGLGIVGCTASNNPSRCWVTLGCNFPAVIYHEFGHNLGMHHSGNPTAEYGDYSCVMGMNSGTALINLPQRVKHNWMRATNGVRTVSATSSHTIYDAWNTATDRFIGLRVNWGSGTWDAYWVSYRLTSAEDPATTTAFHNKVTIHTLAADSTKPILRSTLTVGQTFTDSTRRITIKFVSSSTSARTARIDVTKS